MSKNLYWSLRITLGAVGVIALFQIVPYLTNLLRLLVDLFKLTDTTPEFKIILVSISLWVTCSVINVITNLVFRLHSLLEDKLIRREK